MTPFWAAFFDEIKLAYTLKPTIPESFKFESVPGKNMSDAMSTVPPAKKLAPAINKRRVNALGASVNPQTPR